ncbi:MAG: protein phosphatase 2C domain-containing protein [Chloroflexota bacterium]|nr:protein phosphatase 2C domain-containing protein [Chloroflexota bacterium]
MSQHSSKPITDWMIREKEPMGTYSFRPQKGKGIGLSILFVLVAVLIALQFVLPAVAFAFPTAHAGGTVGKNQALDLAGVAVVRLRTTYVASQAPSSPSGKPGTATPGVTSTSVGISTGGQGVVCTGLGVMVRSWKPVSTELNSWLLTDGDLVNPTQVTCQTAPAAIGSPQTSMQLSKIEIFASTTYTGQPLATLQCGPNAFNCLSDNDPANSNPVLWCTPALVCARHMALLPFHTDKELPYLDPSNGDQLPQTGIGLAESSGALSFSPLPGQAEDLLTPAGISTSGSSTPQHEPGMPVVDTQGNLSGMYLGNGDTPPTLADITRVLHSNNMPALNGVSPLHQNWRAGVTNYYEHKTAVAQSAFHAILNEDSQFKGAADFLALSQGQPPRVAGGQNSASPDTWPMLLGFPLALWIGAGVVLVLLLLLILVTQTVGRAGMRRRRELKQFKSDEAEAERQADLEIQRQKEGPPAVPPSPQAPPPPQASPVPQVVSVGNNNSVPANNGPFAPTMVRCPHCGQTVQPDVAYCPNCHYLLSPSASGLRLRAIPPASPAPVAPESGAPAPISEQPTAIFSPLNQVSEQPTVDFPAGIGQAPTEKNPSPATRLGRNRMLGISVGWRTDPGIKRKHRPNEDSIFAAQGKRVMNSQLQHYGFFVVADGMGGHANGQDASRLAIQTAVNFVLPKLAENKDLSNDEYLKLLTEGVQCANQAVFEHNQRARGDMGTTMTTTLVIGSTAYVANVGDSRTYLHREGQGLQKVTHDHSVVASLVDAGIIKPDDIYTHPKRNQIYRSLGEKPGVEVDPFLVQLQLNDKLLLCSDGLWDMTRDPAIEKVLADSDAELSTVADGLVQLALDGGGEDNITVIVAQVVEVAKRTGKTGLQILAKPDTITIPSLP